MINNNGINLEIKEISSVSDVNENEITMEINKQEKLDDEFYEFESSGDDLSETISLLVVRWKHHSKRV